MALLLFIIIERIIYNISSKNKYFHANFHLYEIILKIKGIGPNKIFSSSFSSDYYPNKVFINENNQNIVSYTYNLIENVNLIRLEWNNKIKSCERMFFECNNIYEFDFSNFDTSEVMNMYGMFYGCSSLVSLNLSNFITSKVQVMWNMFYGCSSLISLNLSNFDTSQVSDMESMFRDCTKLEYINLQNFNEERLVEGIAFYEYMFDKVPDNVVVCIIEEKSKNKIFPQIKNKRCYVNDCSDNWRIKQKIICGNNIKNYIQNFINKDINETQNKKEEIKYIKYR